jgi:trehalose utilization protein
MSGKPIRALCWSERTEPQRVYPEGINGAIVEALAGGGIDASAGNLSDAEQGLSEAVLRETDVLFWWGHAKHGDVSDESVARVLRHVLARGMGLVVLHSACHARPYRALMGTDCAIGGWREDGKSARVWVVEPDHPIADGLERVFVVEREEMYSEPFHIPAPDELVLVAWFEGGEVFRAGCCWQRGRGRVFYFMPGHETYAVYREPAIVRVLQNAARWAAGRA